MNNTKIQKDVNPTIFREYDIRGIYNQTLTDKDAYNIGRSFASIISANNKLVTVLRDGRISSETLSNNLIKGLTEAGADVIDLGVGPTPLLYFSNYEIENVKAGIMVTGSHNPPTHNGFKFIYDKKPFFGKDIQKIKDLIINPIPASNTGNIIKYDLSVIRQKYINTLIKAYTGDRKLKIAWDPGNGASCDIIKLLSEDLKGEHIIINDVIDGTFPNHHPDPTILENLEQLIKVVKEENCDLGICFDGDGDRLGVIDNKGRVILGDQLLMIYATYLLKDDKNHVIIADIKSSNVVFELINKLGGKAIMWKTGHSLIKEKMLEVGASLAGEMSGHVFFADKYYGFDDAIYASVRLMDLLADTNQSLGDLLDSLPKNFSTPEIRIECSDTYKWEAIIKLKKILDRNNILYTDIDGIRVDSNDSWWLIRASNTQGAIIIRIEAKTQQTLSDLTVQVNSYLKQVGVQEISYNI